MFVVKHYCKYVWVIIYLGPCKYLKSPLSSGINGLHIIFILAKFMLAEFSLKKLLLHHYDLSRHIIIRYILQYHINVNGYHFLCFYFGIGSYSR